MTALVRVLALYSSSLPPDLQVEAKAVVDAAVTSQPQLRQVVAEASMQQPPQPLPGAAGSAYPPDVEAEANAFFQSVYEGQRTPEDAVAMLQRYKASADQREQVGPCIECQRVLHDRICTAAYGSLRHQYSCKAPLFAARCAGNAWWRYPWPIEQHLHAPL